ncbi:MAG: hypothetical protein Q8P67_28075, partial [archaeon]|nr:hypothetical protein [archaeon]
YPLPLHSSIESSSSPSPNSTSISASNSTSGSTPIPTSNSSSFSQADNPTAWSRVKELFGRKLRKRTILLILVWFADAAIYYGAYLLVNEIFRQRYSSGDSQPATCGCQPPWTNEAFLTIVLSSLGELPGMVAAAWLLERIGRTWTQTVAFYLTGAMALLLILPSGYRADVVLFFVLRSSINSAFQTTFLASSELYPTRVRSTALGTLSAISRLGAMVAPLISQVLVVYSHSASLALYALFAFASGSLVIFLPETMGRSMVE